MQGGQHGPKNSMGLRSKILQPIRSVLGLLALILVFNFMQNESFANEVHRYVITEAKRAYFV